MKKETAAKTDALFRKKMAKELQKKVHKKSPETARKHWLHCHIKTATNEKVTKCYTAENSYQDSILNLNWWTLA